MTTLQSSVVTNQTPLERMHEAPSINVSSKERWASAVAGGLLIVRAFRSGNRRMLPVLTGAAFMYRAITGKCMVYRSLGISSADGKRTGVASVRHNRGLKVEKSVTINRSPEELYSFWRNFENLPRFMNHVESVKVDGQMSHWVVKAPAGTRVEWNAKIHNEIENELIAWRSLEGADINHAGSVIFRKAPGDRGTEVKVVMSYEPPAGIFASKIAKLLGEEPELQVEEDLRRFKQVMETGEVATAQTPPSG